jgi:hypothetical protein
MCLAGPNWAQLSPRLQAGPCTSHTNIGMCVCECIQVNTESLGMQETDGVVTWPDNGWSCVHKNTQTRAERM